MKKSIELEIEPIDPPNFLRVMKGGEKVMMIGIEELSDESLEELGKEFTKTLIQKAQEKRSVPNPAQ